MRGLELGQQYRMTHETSLNSRRGTLRHVRCAAVVAVLLLCGAFAVPAQTTPRTTAGLSRQAIDTRTRAELESAREAVWRAWFAGDSASLERLIPAALAAGSPWMWEDRTATFQDARHSGASGRRLVDIHFDSTTITLYDDLALMHARFTYVLETPDGKRTTSTGIASEVFVREDGRWVNPFWYLK